MKILFKKTFDTPETLEDDLSVPTVREDLEKTRQALDIAYAGFDNAVNPDMIDCYIYEINALLKRYKHLNDLYVAQTNSVVPEPVQSSCIPRAPLAILLK